MANLAVFPRILLVKVQNSLLPGVSSWALSANFWKVFCWCFLRIACWYLLQALLACGSPVCCQRRLALFLAATMYCSSLSSSSVRLVSSVVVVSWRVEDRVSVKICMAVSMSRVWFSVGLPGMLSCRCVVYLFQLVVRIWYVGWVCWEWDRLNVRSTGMWSESRAVKVC